MSENVTNKVFESIYGDHRALSSPEAFFRDKVYLYKISRMIESLFPADRQAVDILEIGCADGSYCRYLAGRGFCVRGVDISARAIESARRSGVRADRDDIATGLNLPDGSFDAVIAAEVIEHLVDTDKLISEAYRLARPGGYLFISTPNLASLRNRWRLLCGAYPRYSEYRLGADSMGHVRAYTLPVLRRQLQSLGWRVEAAVSPNFLCPMTRDLPRFVKRWAMYLGDKLPGLGSHIIIRARK